MLSACNPESTEAAFAALTSLRDKGAAAFAAVPQTLVREILNFVGADIPDRYVPFLFEQLGVTYKP